MRSAPDWEGETMPYKGFEIDEGRGGDTSVSVRFDFTDSQERRRFADLLGQDARFTAEVGRIARRAVASTKCAKCGGEIDYSGYFPATHTDDGILIEDDKPLCDECGEKLDERREFRICDYCGKPMGEGMTNEGNGLGADFHCHEGKCFEEAMNSLYGEGRWRENPSGEEGEYGGYYDELLENGTWEDTGIFYTQWD